ncbi:hypothetical protein [Synechococcus sp. CBW1107]|uniref:hypothetical protein n=1 Tax=Synechococcus sp. CBW1107 TaxID=2789857 RepID=UPI002AD328D8|nr:hypothetical protein [Synechococcus sp. CBW1107]CAK6688431.1 hypothetical protein IFHNHDMJ_00401 [Synechococcus sp. CBW1107]
MTPFFDRRALEHRHRVGERNGPITMLTPPLRATLVLGVLIAVAGGLWAMIARIPLSVQGTGVLLPVSTINASLSGTNGIAMWMFNRRPESWHAQARNFSNRPDQFSDEQMASLAEAILRASDALPEQESGTTAESASASFSSNLKQSFHGKAMASGRLLLWVQSSSQQERLSSSLDQVKRTLSTGEAQSRNIKDKQSILQKELASRSAYLESMRKLESKGFVSRASILQEQAQVDNIRSQLRSNDNQLIDISGQLSQSYQKLRGELAILVSQQLIFAPRDVYLSQVGPNNGEGVTQGQSVLQLSDDRLDSPELVPIFLSSKEMAQVFPGMEALATPSGFKRSEVGGIRGRVVSKANLPSGLNEVTARVGVQSLAQVIINQEPSPTLAILALERAGEDAMTNSGGYRWSSRGVLTFPPSPGDRLNVEITTRRVHPIDLMLPGLRRFFGITPPQVPSGEEDDANSRQRR